jgi:hypothetical protein
MSTQAQIDANRINSQKSSGPVTDAGKASSSQNRASHRLSQNVTFKVLDDEDETMFHTLFDALMRQFDAFDDFAETAIVERMAQHEWMRRRAIEFQDRIFNKGNLYVETVMQLMKLYMRYESQHERAYASCFNQLLKLRAERRSAKIGFEREKQLCQQIEERKQRHETVQKARQVDTECKIVRALRTAANNPEALDAARKVQTRFQAA